MISHSRQAIKLISWSIRRVDRGVAKIVLELYGLCGEDVSAIKRLTAFMNPDNPREIGNFANEL